MHIYKLYDKVNKYNSTYHKVIKMTIADVKSSTRFDFGIESNSKDPKFRFADHEKISKNSNICVKAYTRTEEELYYLEVCNRRPYWRRKCWNVLSKIIAKEKSSLYKISCFREPYSHNKSKVKVELDLFSYKTKFDLNGVSYKG